MFADPRFLALGIKHARLAVGWDVLTQPRSAAELDDWLRGRRPTGVEPLISFMHSRGAHRRALPSPLRACGSSFAACARSTRGSRRTRPGTRPTTAASRSATGRRPPPRTTSVLRRECPTCTILAPEMLDMPGMGRWVRQFTRWLGFTPRLWGMHNYVEANRFKTTRLRELHARDAQRRDLADRGRRPRAARQQQHHGASPRDREPRRQGDALHLRRDRAAQPADHARLHLPLELVVGEGHVGLGADQPRAGASAAPCSCSRACCATGRGRWAASARSRLP